MEETYSAQERSEMVRTLLEDSVFKKIHSMVSGPELFKVYIKTAKKVGNPPIIDYDFYKRIDIAQQLLLLEIKRGSIPRHPTDADYHPDFFDREDDPRSDSIREGNLRSLDERLMQSK